MGLRASFQDLLDNVFVLLFVAFLESHLRVTNDATGVDDERRSPKRIQFSKGRFVPIKYGIRYFEFLGQLSGFLGVGVHRDYENLETPVGVAFVKLLEMNHLLAGERSVS